MFGFEEIHLELFFIMTSGRSTPCVGVHVLSLWNLRSRLIQALCVIQTYFRLSIQGRRKV